MYTNLMYYVEKPFKKKKGINKVMLVLSVV